MFVTFLQRETFVTEEARPLKTTLRRKIVATKSLTHYELIKTDVRRSYDMLGVTVSSNTSHLSKVFFVRACYGH